MILLNELPVKLIIDSYLEPIVYKITEENFFSVIIVENVSTYEIDFISIEPCCYPFFIFFIFHFDEFVLKAEMKRALLALASTSFDFSAGKFFHYRIYNLAFYWPQKREPQVRKKFYKFHGKTGYDLPLRLPTFFPILIVSSIDL